MTREKKMQAIEICSAHKCTVEMQPTIHGIVNDAFLALTDASGSVIAALLDNHFALSLHDGRLLIDYHKYSCDA